MNHFVVVSAECVNTQLSAEAFKTLLCDKTLTSCLQLMSVGWVYGYVKVNDCVCVCLCVCVHACCKGEKNLFTQSGVCEDLLLWGQNTSPT